MRRLLASTLKSWGVDEHDSARPAEQAILLVASELSTNSVEATSDDFDVAMEVHREYAEISVEDRASKAAQMGAPGPDGGSGRGLAIVAALSCRWGQDPFDGIRKKVWSRVALPANSALARGCTH